MRKLIIAKTTGQDCRYVFAVYDERGFHAYRLTGRTDYGRGLIRKVARKLNADVPARIDWDKIPEGNVIEKFDDEAEARIR